MLYIYIFHLLGLIFLRPTDATPTERWLVEVRSDQATCLEDWRHQYLSDRQDLVFKSMKFGNWFVVETPTSLSAAIRSLPCVISLTKDRRLEWRDTEPNDPAFINQADMRLIGAPKAWDITTGGVTAEGDTIIAAIIDEGYEINHPDLIDNIWHNKGEIPGDGLDNDNNGYTDDYLGYNVELMNDDHPIASHGTSVAGIIGGVGNNNIGITGVNWRVKMMLISGADFESELIEAYTYALEMRLLYKTSQGAKGAFVVVTNLSAGINGEFATDHPLWCAVYDELGDAGVLNVVAAPNNGVSVDVEGDMPTTCTSDYMIAVTNVDLQDHILENAGFGVTSIDIGAPGHGTITTASGMQYKEFAGTSSATPHVTGAIALMYSTPCLEFLEDLASHPDQFARKVRDIVLATGKANNSLDGITVTGRRVQVDAAVRATTNPCNPVVETEIKITHIWPNLVIYSDRYVDVSFIVTGDTANTFLKLYSINGVEEAHFPISGDELASGKIRIHLGSLPPAVYVATLWNGKRKSSAKFVVAN